MSVAVADESGVLIRPVADWKRAVALVGGILLGIIFLVSGGWKLLNPLKTGELLEQARVHAGWGALGAAALGTLEVLAAFLLFSPRFRRIGGLLGSALVLFFIAWIGYYYPQLHGQECSCFPIIKRTIGPGFFIGDGIMLLLGLAAWAWSPIVRTFTRPVMALVALAAFATLSYGVNRSHSHSAQVPTPVIVDGKPQNLATGNVFLFFYDPECMHCDAASRFMSKFNWGTTNVVAIPTNDPQFAASFLHDTGLKAKTSLDTAKLRKAFSFVDPPYGVALVDGQVKATFAQAKFNEPSPKADLQKLGFVR